MYILYFIINLFFIVDSKIHSKIFNNNFRSNHYNSLNNVIDLMNQEKSYAYLSTLNFSNKLNGFPHTSLVGLCIDKNGYPILSMSDISLHTQNIRKNNKCSILISINGLKNQNQKRVTFTGNIEKIIDKNESLEIQKKYLESHHEAFWLKYIDFGMYRMSNIKDIYYIGGFGKATKININKYLELFK
tara:strand:- start:700 stop:1260 length:561 start_codon:yes stop_codon:yes gene_type:complete